MKPLEWLEIIRNAAATVVEEDAVIEKTPVERIILGAALATDVHYLVYPGRRDRLSAHQKQCCREFYQFMHERGEEMLAVWQRGDELTAAQQEYIWAIKAVYFQRARRALKGMSGLTREEVDALRARIAQIEEVGQDVLRRAYLDEDLSEQDIERLRDYRVWLHASVVMQDEGLWAYGLGVAQAQEENFEIGADAPGFRLMKLEAGLRRATYSDYRFIDHAEPLKLAGLLRFFILMPGYERIEDGSGRVRVVARADRLKAKPGEDEDDFVRLSDFRGKKPVLLVLCDGNDWFGDHTFGAIESIYQAYRDRVAIFRVCVTLSDQYIDMRHYFGPNPGPRRSIHATRIEHRARTAKMLHMTYPNISYPYLLDDAESTTRTTWRTQGDSQFVLIDIDGKVAFESGKAMGAWRGRDWPDYIAWANNIETLLAGMLDNGGRYLPGTRSHVGCCYMGAREYPDMPRARRQPFVLGVQNAAEAWIIAADIRHRTARIAEVDAEAGRMVVHVDPVSLEEEFYEVELLPGTRATIDEMPAETSDLRADQTVALQCWEEIGPDGLPVWKAIRVWASRRGALSYHEPMGPLIWACGQITKLDMEAGQLEVELLPRGAEDWTGYKFWQQAGTDATAYGMAAEHLRVMDKWAASDAPYRYRFAIDEAVGIFVNGHEADLSDLKLGDAVGVQFQTAQDERSIILPEFIRVSRA